MSKPPPPSTASAEHNAPPPGPALLRREVLLIFAASLLLTAGLHQLTGLHPWLAANLAALVAAVFLYLPVLALSRSGKDISEYGFHLRGLRRGIRIGILLALVTLPFFLAGHHFWLSSVRGWIFDPDVRAFHRLPDRLWAERGSEPDHLPTLIQRGGRADLTWTPADAPWSLQIHALGDLHALQSFGIPHTIEVTSSPDGSRLLIQGDEAGPLRVRFTPRATELSLQASLAQDLHLPATDWRLGAASHIPPPRWQGPEPHTLRLPLSLLWLLGLIAAQIILIAIPEEFFYRGYLQKRLDEGLPNLRGPVIAGLRLSPAILLVSLGFAIGHWVIGFDPARLAVFFPSLLFGLLRQHTGGLAAPVTYHALCNLMVELTQIHYLPPT